MKLLKIKFALLAIWLMLFSSAAYAGTSGGIYDMSRMLQEGHPFAKTPAAPRFPINTQLANPGISPPANSETTMAPLRGKKWDANSNQCH